MSRIKKIQETLRLDIESTREELLRGHDRDETLRDFLERVKLYRQERRKGDAKPDFDHIDLDALHEMVKVGDLDGVEKSLFRPIKPLDVRPPTGIKRAVRWLWNGWLPLGKVTLLAGSGGVGKGTLMAFLVACATGCRPWPDEQKSRKGTALIISTDDDEEDTLWPRLELSGVKIDRVLIPSTPGIPKWPELAERCRITKDLRLVYIDVMQAGMESGKDGNSAVDVSEHMGRFAEIAAGCGAAVILVHHTNKRTASRIKEGDLSDLVRGSGAWTDAARMAWLYCRDDKDPDKSRLLMRIKCNLPVNWLDGAWRIRSHIREFTDPDGLEGEVYVVESITPEEGQVHDLAHNAVTRQSGGGTEKWEVAAREIMSMVEGGPKLLSDVEDLLSCSRGTFYRAMDALIDSGELRRRGKAPHEFPDDAKPASKVLEAI